MKRLLVLLLLLNLSANAMSLEKVTKNLPSKTGLICGSCAAVGTIFLYANYNPDQISYDAGEACVNYLVNNKLALAGNELACFAVTIGVRNSALFYKKLGSILFTTGSTGLLIKFRKEALEKAGNVAKNLKKLICYKNKKQESDME